MERHDRAAIAVAGAVAIAIYARTLGYEPVFDDQGLIDENGPLALGAWIPYRPLRYLSYRLDSLIGGGAAWVYHATNLILHALVVALTVAIGRRLGLGRAAAAFAGVFVAVHPLAVESVAYIAGRRDLLAAVCGLIAVLLWQDKRRSPSWVLLLLPLAAAAKESGLVFAAVCLLATWTGIAARPGRESRTLLCAVVICVALILAYGGGAALVPAGAVALAIRAPELAWHYASGLTGLRRLSADYPEFTSGATVAAVWITLRLAACLASFTAVAVAAGRMRRPRDRDLGFVLAWFGVVAASIVFAGGFHEPGADRHAYPLLVPSALMCALVFQRVAAGRRRDLKVRITYLVAATALGCLLAGLALRTWTRTPVWESEQALWTDTVAARPGSARAHLNLASIYVDLEQRRKARLHLKAALDAQPDYAPAHFGHALLSCMRGNIHAAHPHLKRAASLGGRPARIDEIRALCTSNAQTHRQQD